MDPGKLWKVVLTGLLSFTLVACASWGTRTISPRINLVAIQLADADVFQQRYRLRLNIQNPNDFPLSLKGVDFHVDINDTRFADGVAGTPVTVPAFGEAVIDVDVVSSIWSLARQLQGMGDGRREQLGYRLYGKLAVTGLVGRIPFETVGEIPLLPAR